MEVVKDDDHVRDQWLTELVEKHRDALLRTCCVVLKDYALAEDAVQDTFLKAYLASDAFREECSEKTWLMRIAMNTCRDIKRRAWVRYLHGHAMPVGVQDAAFETEDDGMMQSILCLPYKEREVLLLYFYQDMTLREIGQSLGLSTSAVFARLSQAKKKLRAVLEGGNEDA